MRYHRLTDSHLTLEIPMTTICTPRDQMPNTIEADGKTFIATGYTGTTMAGCPFGAGHTCYEYWWLNDDREDDSIRVQAITPTMFWVD